LQKISLSEVVSAEATQQAKRWRSPTFTPPASDLKLSTFMVLVNRLSSLQAGKQKAVPTSSEDQPETQLSGDQALHLFTRLPAFHSYACCQQHGAGVDGAGQGSGSASDTGHERPVKPQPGTPEITVCVLKAHVFRDPKLMAAVLKHVRAEGLDVVGLRLVYLSGKTFPNYNPGTGSRLALAESPEPSGVVALAIRGTNAVQRWMDAVGPEDPQLARRTDPQSLRAVHGINREKNLVCFSRPRYARKDLVWWFGGRILPDTITGGTPTNSIAGKLRYWKESPEQPPISISLFFFSFEFCFVVV
jgi:nucleoside diphosphate kinase